MGAIASQITSLTIVNSTVYSDADQRKHQRSATLASVRGIQRGPVNSQRKWPVTRKMFPIDDVIMLTWINFNLLHGYNHMSSKVWGKIARPLRNLYVYTVWIYEWISHFPHFTMDVIIYPCWHYSYSMLEKWAHVELNGEIAQSLSLYFTLEKTEKQNRRLHV